MAKGRELRDKSGRPIKPFWEVDYKVLRAIDRRYVSDVGYPIEGLADYLKKDLPSLTIEEIRKSLKRLIEAGLIFPCIDTGEWAVSPRGKELMNILKNYYLSS